MTKTYISMTAAMPDFSPMIDLWTRQAELALYVNRQWTRIALAPWHAIGASASAKPARVTAAAPAPKAEPAVAPKAEPAVAPKAEPAVAPKPAAPVPAPVAGTPEPRDPAPAAQTEAPEPQPRAAVKPAGIAAPRGGTPDALTGIKGLGPKLEEALNGMGIYHFDQIARWSAAEIAWIDENVGGIRGRASRDDWKGQAATLARSDAG